MPEPTDLPTALAQIEALKAKVHEQDITIARLEERATNSVGGFLTRNEKLLTALFTALLTLLAGGVGTSVVMSALNNDQLSDVKVQQAATKESVNEKIESVGEKVDKVGEKVDKPKGPFDR